MKHTILSISLLSVLFWLTPVRGSEADVIAVTNLQAGVYKVDISPSIGSVMSGYRERTGPSLGLRDPLRVAVVVFDDGERKAAIIGLDVGGVPYEVSDAMRKAIVEKTGIAAESILITASHNHAAPRFNPESDWGREAIEKSIGAAQAALRNKRPVFLGYGEAPITFNINRRLVKDGKALFQPNPEGACDRRVKVLRIDDGSGVPVAVIMHAICHANVFRGDNYYLSADFPGEAQRFIERAYDNRTQTLFLQGCAGDIRANLPGTPSWVDPAKNAIEDSFRSGTETDMQWVGTELGSAVLRASARSVVREERDSRPKKYSVRPAMKSVELPGKQGTKVRFDIQAISIGDILFLTLPGEPFQDFGFNIEKAIGARAKTFVVGYANGFVGYICTEESFKFEGYEPTSSRLAPEAEKIILSEIGSLARRVLQ